MTADQIADVSALLEQMSTVRRSLKLTDQASRHETKEIGGLRRRILEKSEKLSRNLRGLTQTVERGFDEGALQVAGLTELLTRTTGETLVAAQQQVESLSTKSAVVFSELGRSLGSDLSEAYSKGYECFEGAHRRLTHSVKALQELLNEALSAHAASLDGMEQVLAGARAESRNAFARLLDEITEEATSNIDEAIEEIRTTIRQTTAGRCDRVAGELGTVFGRLGDSVERMAKDLAKKDSEALRGAADHARDETDALGDDLATALTDDLARLAEDLERATLTLHQGAAAAGSLDPEVPRLVAAKRVASTIGDLLEMMSFGLH